jgi:hypothetical protein
MRSGRRVWLAGALLAPALIVIGVVPRVPVAASGDVVTAGDIVFVKADANDDIYLRKGSTGALKALTSNRDSLAPDVSPDGSRIAFMTYYSGGTGGYAIWVMKSDGSDKTQISHYPDDGNGWSDSYPKWSPNGTKILFTRYESSSGTWNVYVMNADGSGLTQLTTDGHSGGLAWSPDGKHILLSDNRAPSEFFIMDANGSNRRPLVKRSQLCCSEVFQPAFSPDGSRIYFGTDGEGIQYYSSTNGFADTSHVSGPTVLTSGIQDTYEHPTVSVDGTSIAFDINGTLYQIGSGGGNPVELTNNGSDPSYVNANWPNASTRNLVALGDSVAAGEGINYGFTWTGSKWKRTGPSNPAWMDTTAALGDNYQQCHQSGDGYPNLIALDGGNYRVYNMACTGASALQNNTSGKPEDGGLLDPERFNSKDQPYPENPGPSDPSQAVPAELGGVSSCNGCSPLNKYFNKHNPSIVLLTVGANDLDFPYWVLECYRGTHACNTNANTKLVDGQLAIQKADLLTVLGQLNNWAENKGKQLRVLVTNYYDPMNANNDSCRDYKLSKFVLLTGAEIAWLEQGLTDLNANIAADVKTAQSRDTHLTTSLVDLSTIMSGHQWCTPHPWAYGTSIDYSLKDVFLGANPAPFHPTPEGQNAIYQAVNAVLNSPA